MHSKKLVLVVIVIILAISVSATTWNVEGNLSIADILNIDTTNLFVNIIGSLNATNNITTPKMCIGSDCRASWPTDGAGKIGDDVYLYNDSTTIYFNESKLNATIDERVFNGTPVVQLFNNISGTNEAQIDEIIKVRAAGVLIATGLAQVSANTAGGTNVYIYINGTECSHELEQVQGTQYAIRDEVTCIRYLSPGDYNLTVKNMAFSIISRDNIELQYTFITNTSVAGEILQNGLSLWTNSSGNATYTAGFVGIGTTLPNAQLEVNGTINATNISTSRLDIFNFGTEEGLRIIGNADLMLDHDTNYGSASNIYFRSDSENKAEIYWSNNDEMLHLFNNQTGIVIDGLGNVGIGTTEPESSLHINQYSNPEGEVWTSYKGLQIGNGNEKIILGKSNSSMGFNAPDIYIGGITGNNESGLRLSYSHDFNISVIDVVGNRFDIRGGNLSDPGYGYKKTFLSIDTTTGNVGIGTTTPTHELNVIGDANITGDLFVNSSSIYIGTAKLSNVGGALTWDGNAVQRRVTGTCVGQVVTGINADGTVTCEADNTGVSSFSCTDRIVGFVTSCDNICLAGETCVEATTAGNSIVPCDQSNNGGTCRCCTIS